MVMRLAPQISPLPFFPATLEHLDILMETFSLFLTVVPTVVQELFYCHYRSMV